MEEYRFCGNRPHGKYDDFQMHVRGDVVYLVNHECSMVEEMIDMVEETIKGGHLGSQEFNFLRHGDVRIISGLDEQTKARLERELEVFEKEYV